MAQMDADQAVLVEALERLKDEIERLNESEGHMGAGQTTDMIK